MNIKIYLCSHCKDITLKEFCSNCLNSIKPIEIDSDKLGIRVIEYTRVDNKIFGLIEVSYNGANIRVFGEIERLADRLEIKEWGKRFVFTSMI